MTGVLGKSDKAALLEAIRNRGAGLCRLSLAPELEKELSGTAERSGQGGLPDSVRRTRHKAVARKEDAPKPLSRRAAAFQERRAGLPPRRPRR
jgi:hypothetical protein